MPIHDTVRELGAELRGQRVRVALSLLSLAWGTLSLTLLLAFSFGFEQLFAERSRGIGDGVAIAWPQRTTLPAHGFPRGRTLSVRRADILALPAAVPALHAISAEFTRHERVRVGARVQRVPISGVDPPFAELRLLTPRAGGRFVSPTDIAQRRRVVFLGDALARALFGPLDPVGRTLVLRNASLTVIGVLEPKEQDSDYGGEDKDRAFMPATTFTALFGERTVDDFVFRAKDPRAQAACSAAVVAALAARLRFDPADAAAVAIWDTTEQQRMMFFIFLGFHVMLGLAGTFTLIVGGFGIAHLLQLLVRRRTAEIGLKLAVGADPARIRREWLLQAGVLVLLGSGSGLLVSLAVIAAVRASPLTSEVGMPFVPPLLAAGVAALLALVGLVAGWLPARTASQLDPVAALRGSV